MEIAVIAIFPVNKIVWVNGVEVPKLVNVVCVNGGLTCPEEDDYYNVGFDDPCSTLGCCPWQYVKDCSCNGSCFRVKD